MNKFIIIGHHSSHFLNVERLLQQHGLDPANKSKREQLTPVEITEILRKVCSQQENTSATIFPETIINKSQIAIKGNKNKRRKKQKIISVMPVTGSNNQLKINPIWNGLFLDLMLSNLEQDMWGWADSNAIEVLNYWAELDPEIKFIFVYDHPSNIFLHSNVEQALSLSANEIDNKLQQWQQYNQKMLTLFNQYKSRSVLLCGQQMLDEVNSAVEKVANTLSAPLSLEQQCDVMDVEDDTEQGQNSTLEKFVVNNILQGYKEVANIYEELQNNATLPYLTLPYLTLEGQNSAVLSAWKDLIKQKSDLESQKYTIKKNQDRIAELTSSTTELSERLNTAQNSFSSQKANLELKNHQLQDDLDHSRKNSQELSRQLGNIQEQTTRIITEKEKIAKELQQIKEKNHLLQKELSEENKELLEQVHILQQELEHYFEENQKLKQKPLLFGAPERVKQQLNYQLGAKMIKNSRSLSGWLKMPFSLSHIQREYKIHKKYNQQQKTLPRLEEYQDYLQSEKVKRHLSYQLGELYLKNNIFSFLAKVPKVVKEFRKNKKGYGK
ncbi:hypothetical protein ACU6T4_09395 [Avibacterium paragallinarum]|uniref:hypothetical protein n=3 Tax=Avibacterium paragallinarum TaxID=728 RepID=UPI000614B7EE|nr:hypothetical protein [Avibacterium paragallinarum]AZI14699.1 hypothetical protein EIA51_08805 [Avibacterium paragallinarum]QLD64086.1 hypothetical protein VY92_001245 [Avibacterium paragallinarum]RZN77532.1 hypothetical protein EC523_02335 [Avibacterium paragallinarum]